MMYYSSAVQIVLALTVRTEIRKYLFSGTSQLLGTTTVKQLKVWLSHFFPHLDKYFTDWRYQIQKRQHLITKHYQIIFSYSALPWCMTSLCFKIVIHLTHPLIWHARQAHRSAHIHLSPHSISTSPWIRAESDLDFMYQYNITLKPAQKRCAVLRTQNAQLNQRISETLLSLTSDFPRIT